MRAFITGAIGTAVLLGAMPAVGQPGEPSSAQKVEAVDVTRTPVPAVSAAAATRTGRADLRAADLVAELAPTRTQDYRLLGVTWTRGFDDKAMTVSVRLHSGGRWADWEELDIESDEGEGGRDGTEPLWVGSADGVAVRVTSPGGQRPAGLEVATIDPGAVAAPTADTNVSPAFYTTGTSTTVATSDGAPTYTPRPTIISRASWGAVKNTTCDAPLTGDETRGVLVHHTAGTNTYSQSESASIVRAVQAYHMQSRGWCDIGYNFLVDKYGQIFEGRNGGADRPVRGAHAGDKTVNTYTMGVAMMGTFTSSEPSSALETAMVMLIGWRIGTTFHPATGTYTVGSYSLNRIAGHRNVVSTECPGAMAYAWLSATGGLRDRVAAYIAGYTSPIKTRAAALGVGITGPVYVGEYPFSAGPTGRKARFATLDMYASSRGTFEVAGYFRTGYNALKAQSGVLGVPITESQPTSLSTVTIQRFADGAIYRVSRDGQAAPYALWADLAAKYVDLQEASGPLGSPTKGETLISGGRLRAYFDHGHMTRQADGSVTVSIA